MSRHCAGTPTNMNAPWYFAGPNQAEVLSPSTHSVPGFSDPQHDILLALMDWVEHGNAPDQIIATKYVNDTTHDEVLRQRPLCMYPKQARYVGSGDVNDAGNWQCAMLY
jgi:feruloyl esterase